MTRHVLGPELAPQYTHRHHLCQCMQDANHWQDFRCHIVPYSMHLNATGNMDLFRDLDDHIVVLYCIGKRAAERAVQSKA